MRQQQVRYDCLHGDHDQYDSSDEHLLPGLSLRRRRSFMIGLLGFWFFAYLSSHVVVLPDEYHRQAHRICLTREAAELFWGCYIRISRRSVNPMIEAEVPQVGGPPKAASLPPRKRQRNGCLPDEP